MSSFNLKEIHHIALEHRRHLETSILSIFRIITVLGAGSAVVIDQLNKRPHSDLDMAVIFMPLLIAFLSCILALTSRSIYIIDPDPAKLPIIENHYGSEGNLHRECLARLISENIARSRGLGMALIGITAGVSNFVTWLTYTPSSRAADSSPDSLFEPVSQSRWGSIFAAGVFLVFLIYFGSRVASLQNKPLKTAIKENLVMNIVDKDFVRRPSHLTVEITNGEQTTELSDASNIREE